MNHTKLWLNHEGHEEHEGLKRDKVSIVLNLLTTNPFDYFDVAQYKYAQDRLHEEHEGLKRDKVSIVLNLLTTNPFDYFDVAQYKYAQDRLHEEHELKIHRGHREHREKSFFRHGLTQINTDFIIATEPTEN